VTEAAELDFARAIVDALRVHYGIDTVDRERVAEFISGRCHALPRELHLAFVCGRTALAALGFRGRAPGADILAGRWERIRSAPALGQLCGWLEALFAYGCHAGVQVPRTVKPPPAGELPARCEVAVVGSGPGATAASEVLARAARDVVVLEEGGALLPSVPRLSPLEIPHYRCDGMTFTRGRPKVNVVQGRCLGGGGSVHVGYYYRTPPELLALWRDVHGLAGVDAASMLPRFERIERALDVDFHPAAEHPLGSLLRDGARALGLEGHPVALCGTRDQSRQNTPAANGSLRLCSDARVVLLRPSAGGVALEIRRGDRRHELTADAVLLGAGAVETPRLLRRSGFRGRVGDGLQMHAVIKVVAELGDPRNTAPTTPLPLHVRDPETGATFGWSASSAEQVALNLAAHPRVLHRVRDGARFCVFHAAVHGPSAGSVRERGQRPVVRFNLCDQHCTRLLHAVQRLIALLLAGGAVRVFLNVPRLGPFEASDSPRALTWRTLRMVRTISSYHMSSSCAMGRAATCVADEYGRLRGDPRIRLCDASMLPTVVHVNPQATTMAFAMRNAERYVADVS
jgi:choline dehydrogenase-like flavoprotein